MEAVADHPIEGAAEVAAPAVAVETKPVDGADASGAASESVAAEGTDSKFDHKKCFVGGLNHATDEAGVKAYFSKFGPVVDEIVMRDSMTKQSRGFGFITFATSDAYDACMAGGPHMIDGHKVEPKAAIKRSESHQQKIPKRLFAGGLPQGITEDEFREYFAQYGEIESIEIMYDRETKRMRGFGFVTYKDDTSAVKCMAKGNHEIQGKFVELKGAETREQRISNMQRGYPPRGGRGGYGMGSYGPGHNMGGPPRAQSLTGQRGGPGGYDQGYNNQQQGGYGGGYGAQGGYNGQQNGGYQGNQGYQRNDRPPPLAGARPPQQRPAYEDHRSHGGYGGGYDQGHAAPPAPQAPSHDAYGGYGGYGAQAQGGASAGAYGGYEQQAQKPADRSYDGYGAQPAAQQDASAQGYGHGGYSGGYDQAAAGGYGARAAAAPAASRPPARLTPQRNYNPY